MAYFLSKINIPKYTLFPTNFVFKVSSKKIKIIRLSINAK